MGIYKWPTRGTLTKGPSTHSGGQPVTPSGREVIQGPTVTPSGREVTQGQSTQSGGQPAMPAPERRPGDVANPAAEWARSDDETESEPLLSPASPFTGPESAWIVPEP